jgi:SAM-dependent methyltransferase
MEGYSEAIMQKRGESKTNYVFKPKGDKLEFVGDFESLYKNEDDPWNQSGNDGEISHYYDHSRKRLANQLQQINPDSLLEVGCGLGYTTKIIQESLPVCNVVGMDISATAIKKAVKLFPNLNFFSGNISSIDFFSNVKYDIVVLNQLLWYILESLSHTFENCFAMLNPNGKILISQAFLRTPQKYGKDICDGFEGLISYLDKQEFNITYSELDDSNDFVHNDGLIVVENYDS